MEKTYRALADSPLQLVEFEGEQPVRILDIADHVRTAYGEVTMQELYDFARAKREERKKLFQKVKAELTARYDEKPSWEQLEADPRLQGHVYLDAGAIKRAARGNLSFRLADWMFVIGDGQPPLDSYDEWVLRVLWHKTGDSVVGVLFLKRE